MGIYDVCICCGRALEQLHGSFSDIGAHQDFQNSEFFMPELLLKETCILSACCFISSGTCFYRDLQYSLIVPAELEVVIFLLYYVIIYKYILLYIF